MISVHAPSSNFLSSCIEHKVLLIATREYFGVAFISRFLRMKAASVVIKASEILPTFDALEELGETPHFPIDLLPNIFLLS